MVEIVNPQDAVRETAVEEQIALWLEKRIAELENMDTRIAGYIRVAAQDRADHYRDVVRGIREGAWKA